MCTAARGEPEFGNAPEKRRAGQVERATRVHRRPEFAHLGSIAIDQIKYETLEVVEVEPRTILARADVINYGKALHTSSQTPVFVTCGARGITSFDTTGFSEVPGLQLTTRLDTVGAGDTVISAITLCLSVGVSPAEAAEFANFAAGVTVQKLFTTGTANAQEILAISQDPHYAYQVDLAENPRQAVFLPETEIELCDESILDRLGHIKYAFFDHDGTISTLRHGWEEMQTPESEALSKDLKKRGMTFVGPTIMYAYMQAIGMVNDHTIDCFCYPR